MTLMEPKKYKKKIKEITLSNILNINTSIIGKGTTRHIYLHPNNNNIIIIKILYNVKSNNKLQNYTNKLNFFNIYPNNKKLNSSESEYYFLRHICKDSFKKYFPICYDIVNTNKGIGFCYEKIVDYNGNISNNLYQYVSKYGFTYELTSKLNELKKYIIKK